MPHSGWMLIGLAFFLALFSSCGAATSPLDDSELSYPTFTVVASTEMELDCARMPECCGSEDLAIGFDRAIVAACATFDSSSPSDSIWTEQFIGQLDLWGGFSTDFLPLGFRTQSSIHLARGENGFAAASSGDGGVPLLAFIGADDESVTRHVDFGERCESHSARARDSVWASNHYYGIWSACDLDGQYNVYQIDPFNDLVRHVRREGATGSFQQRLASDGIDTVLVTRRLNGLRFLALEGASIDERYSVDGVEAIDAVLHDGFAVVLYSRRLASDRVALHLVALDLHGDRPPQDVEVTTDRVGLPGLAIGASGDLLLVAWTSAQTRQVFAAPAVFHGRRGALGVGPPTLLLEGEVESTSAVTFDEHGEIAVVSAGQYLFLLRRVDR